MFGTLKAMSTMFMRSAPDYRAHNEATMRQHYEAMRDAMARETPEEKARFYLEVAALLGNRSAAEGAVRFSI